MMLACFHAMIRRLIHQSHNNRIFWQTKISSLDHGWKKSSQIIVKGKLSFDSSPNTSRVTVSCQHSEVQDWATQRGDQEEVPNGTSRFVCLRFAFLKVLDFFIYDALHFESFPYHPCMVYLPTFGWFFLVNIGKYPIHGWYGIGFCS